MKAKRAAHIRLPVAIICLLVLLVGVILLFMAIESLCTVPTDASLSQEFQQSVLQSEHTEVDLVALVYHEVSRNLAWHGAVDFVGYYDFRYICQSDSCDLKAANVQTPVHHYPLCTYDRRVRGTIVAIDIDFRESRIQTDLYGSKWTSVPKPVWDEISSDIASIKEYTLNSIDADIWDIHSSLILSTGKIPGGWIASIRTPGGNLIHWENVVYSEYKRTKEEEQ